MAGSGLDNPLGTGMGLAGRAMRDRDEDQVTEGMSDDEKIIYEAHKRYNSAVNWESTARARGDMDEKFGLGDAYNGYQWPDQLYNDRQSAMGQKPTLTINKTRQHCLQIINDAKQNKPGVNIKPTGGGASYQAAQTFQAIIRHIEYESAAEQAYDWAMDRMVYRGIGYWRILPVHTSEHSFEQKLLIKRIKNPNAVYLDTNIQDVDGLDAEWGFIFDDLAKDRFRQLYPDFRDIANQAPLGNRTDSWILSNQVKVAEYYRRHRVPDVLHLIRDENGNEANVLASRFSGRMEVLRDALAAMEARNERLQQRKVQRLEVQWYKIAGEEIIERTISPGKYIPIIRVCAEETVINGQMDRRSHVRSLIDAQRMYNYNSSASVEYGALQTKVPWIAPVEAISGYEVYWESANIQNFSWMPYRATLDNGRVVLPKPERPQPPASSDAFVMGMRVAREEMMMASGQYEANFGQKSNEQSGIAIDLRQRKGETATYHYVDAQAVAIRATGKVLLDQIPIIYDTERVIRIKAEDGTERDIRIDPEAKVPYAEAEKEQADQAAAIIFNPNVGEYEVVADPGPSYATRRQEAFNALTQILQADPQLMHVFGDLYFLSADFPLAAKMAERLKRLIPPNILGEGPSPDVQMLTEQVEKMKGIIQTLIQEGVEDNLDNKRKDADNRVAEFDAITRRFAALKDMLPMDQEGLRAVVRDLVGEALTLILGPQAPVPPATGEIVNPPAQQQEAA